MKRNAILVAGIMCVAAASQAQESDYSTSRNELESSSTTTSELITRDPQQNVLPPSYPSPSAAVQHDPATSRSSDYDQEQSRRLSRDLSADSSVRGGSLDARNYDQAANDDEIEGAPNPINPADKADSSIRGGSIYSRDREWNHDSEPSSGQLDSKRHLKADSSIRGGSIEARGGREAAASYEQQPTHSYNLDTSNPSTSAGSANWSLSDDDYLNRDELGSENLDSDIEMDNDASIGGAARGESGSGSSTLDDVELDIHGSASDRNSSDLNSSDKLEENISGEFDLDSQTRSSSDLSSSTHLDIEAADPNTVDVPNSALSSDRSTDITHGVRDIPATPDPSVSGGFETEASGAAASGEVGTSSSEDDESDSFQSKDPLLRSDFQTPETDLDFTYSDNRAHGVGSLATGEFGATSVQQSAGLSGMSNGEMERSIKGRLTRESTGNHGLMRQEVARNIQVKANGGTVTLTGSVPSEKDKQMIEVRVAEMSGVKKVNNELTVTPEADPANRELGQSRDLEDVTNDLQD